MMLAECVGNAARWPRCGVFVAVVRVQHGLWRRQEIAHLTCIGEEEQAEIQGDEDKVDGKH